MNAGVRNRCRRCGRRATLGAFVLALGLALPSIPASAQEPRGAGGDEIRMLRDAERHAAQGELDRAAEVIEAVVERSPTSITAILALERVLRQQGRLAELPPRLKPLIEAQPRSAQAHQILARTYADLGDLDALERAGERWIDATPRLETPYRELAGLWEERGRQAEAIRLLERGRAAVGRMDALALELGGLYARRGDLERSAREWDLAIGADARGLSRVRRRLAELPDAGAGLVPSLVHALASEGTAPRRRAAVELSIDAGLEAQAAEIARHVARSLSGPEREGFLSDVARRADGARLHRLAYWAYSEFLDAGAPGVDALAVRSRVADLALAVGDTARAQRFYAELESAFAAGSAARRDAAAQRITLIAIQGDVERAVVEYRAFRAEFGGSEAADELAATVAAAVLAGADTELAEELVAAAAGAGADRVRGRIALERGEIAEARRSFMSAASGLSGAEATEMIGLAALLGRLSEEGGRLLGRAMSRLTAGEPGSGVRVLREESRALGGTERAAILDFAAGLADRLGLGHEAATVRRTLIEEHPAAAEAPAAMLELARRLATQPGAREEARELLERLVVEHARSALAPQARRELDRLRRQTDARAGS